MASILFRDEKPERAERGKLSPEKIMSMLFTFRDTAHKFHLNCMIIGTGSHAQHIALDGLYKGLQDFQDSILEQMMGYLQRPINAPITGVNAPEYTGTEDAISLCNSIMEFSKELIAYASAKDMPNIENVAQEVSGLAAHTKYFLMFK